MGCFIWPPPPAALRLGTLCCTGPWGSQMPPHTHWPNQPHRLPQTQHCPQQLPHRTCTKHKYRQPRSFLLLVWKWLTFTSESTNSRFTGKHMPMDPQSQHGPPSPFYTLFQLFLPSPLPLHFSPTGCVLLLTPSPQRPSGLGSCLLQSPGLVAVSWWPLSVAVKVVSFFSPFSLSVRFVPLSFVCCSPFHLLSPFTLKRTSINDLKETDALTFHLPRDVSV